MSLLAAPAAAPAAGIAHRRIDIACVAAMFDVAVMCGTRVRGQDREPACAVRPIATGARGRGPAAPQSEQKRQDRKQAKDCNRNHRHFQTPFPEVLRHMTEQPT